MCTVARIALIILLYLQLAASLKKSSISGESGSTWIQTDSLQRHVLDSASVVYHDNETANSNRLYLPANLLDAEDVSTLYNALSTFTRTDDEVEVEYEGLPFIVNGFFQVNTNLSVYFTVLMTETKAQSVQNRIRAEFAENSSTIDQENRYTVSPGIVLDFRLMFDKPVWQYILVITFQDFLRMQNYGPTLMFAYYCLMAVSTIITIPGSVLICVSILKYKHLQTPPNVYVFNLAVADILLLTLHIYILVSVIFITPHTKESHFAGPSDHQAPLLWQWHHPPCSEPGNVIPSVWSVVCLTTICTTIDRYVAICHPFLGLRTSTFSRAVKVNVTVWALSLIQVLYYKLVPVNEDILYDMWWLVMFIFLPICVILPSYMCIALSLWKSSKMRQSCGTKIQPLTKKSIKIAGVIAVQYIFCWAPVATYILLTKTINIQKYVFVCVIIEYVVCDLFLLGSMFNPMLYALVSKDFRKAFKDLSLLCIGCIRRALW